MKLKQSCFALIIIASAILSGVMLGFAPAQGTPMEGRKLFAQHCEQCHQTKGGQDFGNIGPSLVNVQKRYPDRKDVAAIVWDETKRNPQTVMPPFGRNFILTKKEFEVIIDYLYNQPVLQMAKQQGDN